ncbi:TolC family protein [Planctomycetota bacterium]
MHHIKIIMLIIILTILCHGSAVYAQENGKLDLVQCVDMALKRSDRLKQSAADIGEAEAGRIQARSGYFPRIDFAAESVRVNEVPSLDAGMLSIDFGADRYTSYGITVEQPLYLGGRTKALINAVEKNINSARERYSMQKQAVILNTALVYLNILRLQAVVKVDEEALDLKKKHLKDIVSRREAGTVSKYELIRAEAEKLGTEGILIGSVQELAEARHALSEVTGCSPDAVITGPLKFRDVHADADKQIASGLKGRHDLRACREMVDAAAFKKRADKADYFPHFFVRGSTGMQKPEFGELGGEDKFNSVWNIGIGMRFMLFNGFESRGKLAAASHRISRMEAECGFLKKRIERDIRNICMLLDKTSEIVRIQKEAVAKAEEALKLVTDGYNTKVNTQLEVLDAQLHVSQRKKDLVNALFSHESAQIRLEFITGRLNTKWIRSR